MKTIFLDLDNTLLGNNMRQFLPPYFAALHQRLKQYLGGDNLQEVMHESIKVLQANSDPTTSNYDAFMNDFCDRLGCSRETLQAIVDDFYRDDYPKLRQYTTYYPEAELLVQRLLDDGYSIVIATNPLFPATAIEQRLVWAGIEAFPFQHITTMENSHYAKPNSKYYEEILALTEADPATTWMVGDDPINDIKPAHQLGMKTWWISEGHRTGPMPPYTLRGPISSLLDWLEQRGLP